MLSSNMKIAKLEVTLKKEPLKKFQNFKVKSYILKSGFQFLDKTRQIFSSCQHFRKDCKK